ncbi:hypothetical protein ALI22I_13735 [Saccharothrix sp. ALI-22-I]|nr:hypothetical protein ALI22I_13735 [Saccharothrix sp. ALI-22-I]
MDPHKRSATIEIINGREQVLDTGRFGTDRDGYRRMPAVGHGRKERIWAVEGCHGIGRHLAQRLVADGETVIDVPAKLSARVRVLATGQGRKTDPVDAHSVALVALRTKGLQHVEADDATAALRLLVDHRDELGHARTQTVNRLHRLLLELLPGGAKKFLSAAQARALLGVDFRGVEELRREAAEVVVVGMCGCGCSSVDFRGGPGLGMTVRVNAAVSGSDDGLFLYTVGTLQGREVLGGIEWVSVADTDPVEFPAPDLLDIRTARPTRTPARCSS